MEEKRRYQLNRDKANADYKADCREQCTQDRHNGFVDGHLRYDGQFANLVGLEKSL